MTSATGNNSVEDLTMPGKMVAHARESKGLTQADLAQRIRLDPKFVRHLELDNYDQLPGPTFIKGYLRSIANELGLPAEPMLEAYKRIAKAEDEPTLSDFESRPPAQISSNNFLVRAGTYALAITSLLLIIFWWQSNNTLSNNNDGQGPLENSTTHTNTPLPYEFDQISHSNSPYFRKAEPESPAIQLDAGPSAERGEQLEGDAELTPSTFELSLTTTAESWVEIYDTDSKRLYFGMANARAPITVSSNKPLDLLIGNTPTVKLTINGELINLVPLAVDGVAKFKFP
jgi:cytoskeleton protein RodZ